MLVIKRDGRKVPFDPQKITGAVLKALTSIKEHELVPNQPSITANDPGADETAKNVSQKVVSKILSEQEDLENKEMSVEDIQDLVEKTLIELNMPATAKEYILYRQHRTNVRTMNGAMLNEIEKIITVDAADSNDKRENANINTDSCMGAMLKVGTIGTKTYAMSKIIRPEHVDLHKRGVAHLHDMDFSLLTINCLQIPLGKLLKRGFSTGHGYLRTPATIQSAAALTCIAIQSSQNDHLNFNWSL